MKLNSSNIQKMVKYARTRGFIPLTGPLALYINADEQVNMMADTQLMKHVKIEPSQMWYKFSDSEVLKIIVLGRISNWFISDITGIFSPKR